MNLSYQVQNMLKLLKSNKTKVEINGDIKKEQYNFISNTIYISMANKITQKGLEETNPFCLKLIAMYKAYFSSKQSAFLHILGILLTNLSVIMVAMTVLFRLVLGRSRGVCILTGVIILVLMLLKMSMENNAYKKACMYIKKNVSKINDENITKENIQKVESTINKNKIKLIINKEGPRLIILIVLLLLMI